MGDYNGLYILGGIVGGIPLVTNTINAYLQFTNSEYDKKYGRLIMKPRELWRWHKQEYNTSSPFLILQMILAYPGYTVGRTLHNLIKPDNRNPINGTSRS